MSTQHLTKIETAGQHAEAAAEARFLAARIRPEPAAPGEGLFMTFGKSLLAEPDADPYRKTRFLIAYHLNTAAKLLGEIAEHMPKEPAK